MNIISHISIKHHAVIHLLCPTHFSLKVHVVSSHAIPFLSMYTSRLSTQKFICFCFQNKKKYIRLQQSDTTSYNNIMIIQLVKYDCSFVLSCERIHFTPQAIEVFFSTYFFYSVSVYTPLFYGIVNYFVYPGFRQ